MSFLRRVARDVSRDIQVIIKEATGGSSKPKRQRYDPKKAKKRKFGKGKFKGKFIPRADFLKKMQEKYSDKGTSLNTQDSARDPSRLRRAQRKNNLALNTKIRRAEEDFQRLAFAYEQADQMRREGGHGITQDEVMRIYSAKVRAEVILEKLAEAHGSEKVYYMQSRRDPAMHKYSRHRRKHKSARRMTDDLGYYQRNKSMYEPRFLDSLRPKIRTPRGARNGTVVLLRKNGSVLRSWYSSDPDDRRQNENRLKAWAVMHGYGGAQKKDDGNWYALKEPGYRPLRDPGRLSRKSSRTARDFSDDVRHLSLTALGRLLRQYHQRGDEEKCHVIEKEIDRRTKSYFGKGRR